jgi:hypothetical protein
MIKSAVKHDFKLDQATHVYTLDGRRILGVTDILLDNDMVDPRWFTEHARSRGVSVHLACHFSDQGKLDWSTLDADLHGYVHSWIKFKDRAKFRVLQSEFSQFHPSLYYAGTPDRLVQLDRTQAILDIKTGDPEPAHRYQTAAYDALIGPTEGSARRRISVHLKADGSEAAAIEHHDFNDFAGFCAMLLCTRIREKHRIRKGEQNVNH